jgi:transcriptional regulator with XRE-family HTH domain
MGTHVDVEIGNRLKALRLTAGLSQEKLADAIGLTFQQVQKYEKGTNRIGGSRLQQIATILGVPASAFFGETASGEQLEALAGMTRTGIQIAREVSALPASAQRHVLNIIESIRSAREAA